MYENEKMPLLRKKNFIYLIVCKQKKSRIYLPKVRKESKVAVDKKVILFFIVAVVISLAIMAGWILAGLVSNPLGILLVAIPLIIFTAASPNFVHYEPYKKYRKSMEAKKQA